MNWFRGGYYGTWYAGFGCLFARWVGDHPYPLLLAFGCFVCAPVLLLGICLALDSERFTDRRAAVDAVVRAGRVNRWVVACAGVLGAVVGVALLALAGGLIDVIEFWALPLVLAAPVAGWWAGVGGLAAWARPAPAGSV